MPRLPKGTPVVECPKCLKRFIGLNPDSPAFIKHLAKPHIHCNICLRWFTKVNHWTKAHGVKYGEHSEELSVLQEQHVMQTSPEDGVDLS